MFKLSSSSFLGGRRIVIVLISRIDLNYRNQRNRGIKMKRCGFTMIELVFVIVILGILGAIAIPRLTATRDDAQNVVMAQNIMTGAGEIASYAVAMGETNDSLSVMSNGIKSLVNEGKAHLNTAEKAAYIHRGSVNDCIIIDINSSNIDENLTLTYGEGGGDTLCLGLQKIVDISRYPIQIRGARVEH